jgi:hypothetical protein
MLLLSDDFFAVANSTASPTSFTAVSTYDSASELTTAASDVTDLPPQQIISEEPSEGMALVSPRTDGSGECVIVIIILNFSNGITATTTTTATTSSSGSSGSTQSGTVLQTIARSLNNLVHSDPRRIGLIDSHVTPGRVVTNALSTFSNLI